MGGAGRGRGARQPFQNMLAAGAASRLPVFRPRAGDDKQELLALPRRIGTFQLSEEPFHDCCPLFLPRSPALYASAADLDEAETGLNVIELTKQALEASVLERYSYSGANVERVEVGPAVANAAGNSVSELNQQKR